jgi:hypothetical protein
VDATEAALAAQRAGAPSRPADAASERDLLLRDDPDPDDEPGAQSRQSGVRRIDLS